MGIGTDADIVTAAHAMPGRALEKYFGARLTIDVRVHAFPCAVLGIAEGSAGFVSAAAAPHFGRMNGKDGLRVDQIFRGEARQRRIQDNVQRSMPRNDAAAAAFIDCCRDGAVEASLSEFHISI